MFRTRVIPCLLLKDGGLVKGVEYKNHQYVSDPINAIKIFNEKEVDELIVLDILASKNGVAPNFKLIEEFSSECFMPLCYGGGIKTIEQVETLFSIGVEKVSVQSAAYCDMDLVRKIADRFGSQSVVVSIDVKKDFFRRERLYNPSKKKNISRNYMDFIQDCVNAGAGEIVINSVNHEGHMNGMNLELISKVSKSVPIPVIAGCGVGSLNDLKLASDSGASAVAVGSFFVYHGIHRAVLITFPESAELERLLG